MSSPWRALLWLVLPTRLVGPRPLSSWLGPVLTIAVFLIVLAMPMLILGQAHRGIQRIDNPQNLHLMSLSRNDSIQMMELLSQQALKKAADQQNEVPPLPVLFVGAPEPLREATSQALVSRGGKVASSDCTDCVVMTWNSGRGWNAHLRGGASGTDGDLPVLLSAMAIRKGLYDAHPLPGITIDPEAILPAAKALLSSSIAGLSAMFLMFCCWAVVLTMSAHGYRWDLWRNAGFLEPWVMVVHSPWVLFLSQLLRHMFLAWIVFAVVLSMAFLFGLPLSWRFTATLLLLLPVFSLFVGLWGFLATVMFHHRRGRMLARIFLSPALLLIGWGLRLFLAWGVLRMEQPFLAWQKVSQLDQSVPWALGLVPFLLAGCGLLALLIQWRLGRRREGLRQAK